MMDHLLWESETKYRQATASLAAGDNERALIAFQQGVEALLRWRLVHDGADLAMAINPTRVGWPELLLFLDARYAVPEQTRAFLQAMAGRYQQVAAGGHPELPAELLQHYAEQIQGLFQRFYPRPGQAHVVAPPAPAYARVRPEAPSAAAAPPTPAPPAPPAPPASAWAGGDLTVSPEKLAALNTRRDPAGPAAATNPVPAARPPAQEPGGPPGTTYETADQRAARQAAEQRQRVLAAGQQRREMRLSGKPFCPRCQAELLGTEAACPRCRFDLAGYRTGRAAGAPRAAGRPSPSRLERLFGRRPPPA